MRRKDEAERVVENAIHVPSDADDAPVTGTRRNIERSDHSKEPDQTVAYPRRKREAGDRPR